MFWDRLVRKYGHTSFYSTPDGDWQRDFKVDEFVEIQVSSRKSADARGLASLLERLKPRDRLIVSELSRLGRMGVWPREGLGFLSSG